MIRSTPPLPLVAFGFAATVTMATAARTTWPQEASAPVAGAEVAPPAAADTLTTESADPPPEAASADLSAAPGGSPPVSEPGSFFRSTAPPAESRFSAAEVASEIVADVDAGDTTAPEAEPSAGMSRFGAPPPFSAAPTADAAPPVPAFTTAPAAVPPQASLPQQGLPPAAGLGAAPPPTAAAAATAADGTQSVLTAPPEAADTAASAGFASQPPSQAFGGPSATSLQEPATFSDGAAVEMAGSNQAADAGQPAGQRPAMPSGPATTLIDAALDVAANGGSPAALASLAERPLPLLEALERSADRGRRLWITQAYWKLVEQAVVLRWTAEAAERLELVAPGGDPYDRATLDVAVASRLADVAAARAALVAAQQELVDLVRLPASEPLPWPVDRPLATSYETHFDVLFASRIATGRIRAINRSLPLEHEEVDARAAAVLAATTAVEMAENDHARGVRGIESVIAAHAGLLEQQKALARAVTGYNDDIVEYVMAVADFSVPDNQFATMLIGAPTPWRPPVALTSATGPTNGVPTLAVPPPTAGQPPAAGGFPAQ